MNLKEGRGGGGGNVLDLENFVYLKTFLKEFWVCLRIESFLDEVFVFSVRKSFF